MHGSNSSSVARVFSLFFLSKNLRAVYYKRHGRQFRGSPPVTATPRCRKKEFLFAELRVSNSGRRRERNNVGVLGDNWREAHLLRLSNAVLSAQVAIGFHCECATVFMSEPA